MMKVMTTYQAIKAVIGDALPDKLLLACLNSIIHNDDAHNLDHIKTVVTLGNTLCDKLGVEMKTRQMVLAGCLMHDLGCRYHRKTHHQISYGLAFEYLEKFGDGIFSEDEILTVAESCLQHRASWTESRDKIVCDLVALADRGIWSKKEYVTRSVQFHLHRIGEMGPEAVRQEVLAHIPDKFGHNGYAWTSYPAIGFQLYKEEIDDFKEFALDPDKINAMIDLIFNELHIYR
ncbi:HD domain-containing protein [Salmonella enterica]|nr:HD domain-containing protein [Salmonella enterica subsp. enterica serovar Minnesota]EJI5696440.1 HD domain-containing protein [Salmonella enterica]